MPPTDENQETDDMTAAPVENPTPEAPATPTVPAPIDPATELEPSDEFKERVKRMAAALPYSEAQDEPVPHDDLTVRRLEVYGAAWETSLAAANVEDLASWTLDDLGPDQHAGMLRRFVNDLGPDASVRNLILGGRVGSGKSSAAIAAGNLAVEHGLMVRFVQHATYLRWLRPDGAPNNMPDWQVRKRFRDCDLLILDDFGAGLDTDKPATQFVRDETTALVGDRIDTPGKATILTTNVRAEDLEVMIDDRLVSRLSKQGQALRFTGEDRRGRLSW